MPLQETYSLLSLDEDVDEERNTSTLYAPTKNMLSAAREIISCLVDHDKDKATLRGGRRSTRDIDLITTLKMRGVWDAITGKERIVIPDSRLIEGVIKVFIKTGAPWDECPEQHRIEVDIKQTGFRGSPLRLEESTEILGPFDLFGEALHFRVLNIAAMIRIKVECCLTREEQRDFDDVKYMVISRTSEVKAALEAGTLEEDELMEAIEGEVMGDETSRAELLALLSLPRHRTADDDQSCI